MRSARLLLVLAPLAVLRPARAADDGAYADGVRRTTETATLRSPFGPVRTPLTLELSNFLLDHPDLSAHLVNRHRIAPYRVTMRGPRESDADDGAGTKGLIAMIEREETRRRYFGDGVHESSVFPDLRATAVIDLDLHEEPPAAGPQKPSEPALPGLSRVPQACGPEVAASFYVYIRVKSRIAHAMTRALRPFIGKAVTRIFMKAFLVADQVGRLLARDPDGIAREVLAFPGLPAAERDSFRTMLARFKERRGGCSNPGNAAATPRSYPSGR